MELSRLEPNRASQPSRPELALGARELTKDVVRTILSIHASLSVEVGLLANDTDLFSVGFEPVSTVAVMVAIEERFGIEFPDAMLRPARFRSIAAITQGVEELLGSAAVPG